MSGGKHADDDTDGTINRLDPDAAAYEGPFRLVSWEDDGPLDLAEPTIDELGEVHWPAPYFTGEWAGAHATRLQLSPRAVAARTVGLTAETLRAGMGGPLALERYRQLLPAFSRFLVAAGCTTVNRAAMAFAQLGHEAVGLKYNRELWGPSAQQKKYEPGTDLARQLGNTRAGDGYRYRGGGWIQTTGRGNFGKVSRWAFEHGYVPTPTFFLDNPDLLGDDRYVWIGPTWYWTVARPDINSLCDRGDLDTVTRRINGGLTGIDDRRRRWNACRALGTALLPNLAPAPAPAPPRPKGPVKMIDRQFDGPFPGPRNGRIIIPVGNGAQAAQAWFSCSFDGGVHVKAWFQDAKGGSDAAAPGTRAPIDWHLGNAERGVVEIPAGTEFVQYELSDAEGSGAILIETRSA